MSWVASVTNRLRTVGELLSFFGSGDRWWLLPVVVVLSLFGLLALLAQSSVLAPFIYTLF
jgi:hypothetical protein